MKKNLVLLIVTLNMPLFAMDSGWNRRQSLASTEQRLVAHKESMRQRYYPDVEAAQTPEGREIAFDYFYGQLMKRPLPNGILFEQAYIYWDEMILNPNDPFIPALKDYADKLLTLAFKLRKSTLKKKKHDGNYLKPWMLLIGK